MHPLFAIPIFILVMFCVFQITFGTFGSMLSDMLDTLFNVQFANMLENILTSAEVGAFFKGLLLDGIISGIGSVITFFPQIMLLFLFLSFLEDSGYMARTAFIMDKLFYKNRSFGQVVCTYDNGIWVQCSCDNGSQNT